MEKEEALLPGGVEPGLDLADLLPQLERLERDDFSVVVLLDVESQSPAFARNARGRPRPARKRPWATSGRWSPTSRNESAGGPPGGCRTSGLSTKIHRTLFPRRQQRLWLPGRCAWN